MLRMAFGTRTGVSVFEGEWGALRPAFRCLEKEDILTVRFFPGAPADLMAGSYGNGLFRALDNGEKEEKVDFPEAYLRTVAFATDDPGTLYAGAEPAELYRSQDGGVTWVPLHLLDLPQAKSWSLPYSPRAGALRSLILPAADPFLIYAGVEQGGFLRSRDHGAHWELFDQTVDKDIHSLSLCPERPGRLFAATGEGVYRTLDGGERWDRCTEDYTRGVAILSDEPGTIFAGPAADVGRGGWIEVSRDGGDSWSRCMKGLPDPLEEMVQLLFCSDELPGRILALTSDGCLFEAETGTVHWRRIFPEVEAIQSLALCRM
jgi:photosystem II stability/assembly factor-like uncharacterized protein